MLYGQILNFPNHKLSQQASIFLIACINSKNLKHKEFSNDRLICPILQEIKDLNEKNKDYSIIVSFFAGDTPASQSLGGFVETVGNANYPCRHCSIHKRNLTKIHWERECSMRELNDVIRTAERLEDGNINGIKRYTKIFDYKDIFDPIKQSPQDPMHVILEGLARNIVMLYLKQWTKGSHPRSTLEELNSRLQNFKYGFLKEKSRMKPFTENDLKKDTLAISASQMRSLLLLFPFIFHDIIDLESDDYRYSFITFHQYIYF